MIKVVVKNDSLERAEQLLIGLPGGFQQALVSSLNRALLEARTTGAREGAKRYTAKVGIIRKTMAMHRASKSNIEAELVSRGRRLPMRYFAHKPKTDTTGAKRRLVTSEIRRGSLKPIGQGFVYHGMIMQRVGAASLPVQQLYTLSVPNILNNPEIVDAVQNKMVQAVEKRLEHETIRLLKGYAGDSKWSK